jgi:rhodanese-related sulfurtransferase
LAFAFEAPRDSIPIMTSASPENRREREGTSVRYSLAGDEALRLWLTLRDVSRARLAEVARAAEDYLGKDVERIGRAELLTRLETGDAVLVDVRPVEEYAAGHIEGARSIPIDELETRLAELPDDAEIVAYCRGPFCAYAHQAVRRLRVEGRAARRLEEGWPEWRLAQRGPDQPKPKRLAEAAGPGQRG